MSMPQGGEPSPWDSGQSWETGQPWDTGEQAGAAGQHRPGDTPGPGRAPGHGSAPEPDILDSQGGTPAQGGGRPDRGDGVPGQGGGMPGPPQGGMPGPEPGSPQYPQYGGAQPGGHQYGGPMRGMPISPVNEIETRVTGKRIVQYIIDYCITAAVAGLVFWVLDRGHGAVNVILVVIAIVVDAAWYFWYWVLRPYRANGQTLGMQLLGLRVISRDGGPASMMQLFIRAILLIVDTFFWGLVGFLTIISSRYRQRVGDHAAKTLVVRASVEPIPAQRQYAGAGRAGSR